MAQVSLRINGRDYDVTCEEGQQDHVLRLGAFIEERVRGLAEQIGQVGDARLLLLVSLTIAHELAEGRAGGNAVDEAAEARMARALDGFAERIEQLADGLENA